MSEIKVRVIKIKKGLDGKVRLTIWYPGAENEPTLVFSKLPQELALEYFTTSTKLEMDNLRGAPESA